MGVTREVSIAPYLSLSRREKPPRGAQWRDGAAALLGPEHGLLSGSSLISCVLPPPPSLPRSGPSP